MNKLYGVVPPMTTPFDEDEEINYDMLKKDVTHLVEKSKVHGLAIGGSNPTLMGRSPSSSSS